VGHKFLGAAGPLWNSAGNTRFFGQLTCAHYVSHLAIILSGHAFDLGAQQGHISCSKTAFSSANGSVHGQPRLDKPATEYSGDQGKLRVAVCLETCRAIRPMSENAT
jgi:hypothetical protein